MTQDQFYTWMEDSATMNADSAVQLREVVKKYPYFQVAQLLLAKNLKQENHIGQLDQLHLATLAATERKLFHDYMRNKRVVKLEEEAIETPVVSGEKEVELEVVTNVDAPFEHLLPNELIPEPMVYQLEKADLPDIIPSEEEKVEEQPEPQELSFTEWLEYAQTEGAKKESSSTSLKPRKQPTLKSQLELIEDFIINKPEQDSKKRAEFFNPQKVAAKSTEQDFTMVSETLAKIYAQQGKYELAIQAYKALSLKYPEKSIYFAARLKEIEELNSEK